MASPSKPRANDQAILYLINRKHHAAKGVLRDILHRFEVPMESMHFPTPTMLLDYLLHRITGIELMLKFLSDNWTNHDIASMYRTVFGRDHADPDFMRRVGAAITSQRYLLEPASGLGENVPELEALNMELRREIERRVSEYRNSLDIRLSRRFLDFLRENASTYYRGESVVGDDIKDPEKREAAFRRSREKLEEIRRNIAAFADAANCMPFGHIQWARFVAGG